ncbi:class I SAM-dependent methyltransferase [Vibrio diazotrophicus]|uniref:Methyltransferase family protein n=1 Tax=Vibrio diazotrophicus TaxID=685 RepID=A0ABX4WDA0_VIBDI|nr:class I SAM-dependent methyltransferase [Vibrio diazotrophicus]PNI00926.1 hypothetical protein C1O25_09655 [Vibrio diazotrophicus]
MKNIINYFLSLFNLRIIKNSTFLNINSKDDKFNDLSVEINSLKEQMYLSKSEYTKMIISLKWDLIDILENEEKKEKNTSCPICGNVEKIELVKTFISECIFLGGKLERYKCSCCGVIYGPDKVLKLADNKLGEEYRLHYSVFSEGDSTESEIRSFFTLNPKKGKKYLNYGAGSWSKTIEKLRSDGWDVYGYEPFSSNDENIPYIITSSEQLETIKFDGIFSNNVLEHLRYPITELKYISSHLKPSGKLAMATPCFEYLYEYTRFHLFFFTGESKYILADKACLNVDDFIVDGEFMCMLYTPKKDVVS